MRTATAESLGLHDDIRRLRDRMREMAVNDRAVEDAVLDHCLHAAGNDAAVDLSLTELDYDEGGVQVVLYRQPYPDQPAEQHSVETISA